MCKNVRIAVAFERVKSRAGGVVPSAGAQKDNPSSNVLGQLRARKASPSPVVESHHVAVLDAARHCIRRIDEYGFTALDFFPHRQRAVVQLAVQARRWLT